MPHSADDSLEHSLQQNIGTEQKSIQVGDQKEMSEFEKRVLSAATVDQGQMVLSRYKGNRNYLFYKCANIRTL